MKLTITTLTLLLTAVSAMPAAEDENLDKRQCGTVNGPCDINNCNGWNTPSNGQGISRSGQDAGCPCAGTCGNATGSCCANGCSASGGVCQAGKYAGCNCYY